MGHVIELTVREITLLAVEPPAPPTAAARRQLPRLSGSSARTTTKQVSSGVALTRRNETVSLLGRVNHCLVLTFG